MEPSQGGTSSPATTWRWGRGLVLLALAAGVAVGAWAVWRRPGTRPAAPPESPYLNTRPGVKYVGDRACAQCHAEVEQFHEYHPMGRSLEDVRAATPLEDY